MFSICTSFALNVKEIKWNPERVSNMKLFINECNQEGLNYPSKLDDRKRLEKNNPTITPNILYTKKKKYFQHMFQNITYPRKTNNSFNDFKQRKRRMASS